MSIDYDGRRFSPVGEPSATGRVAEYRQQGDLLSGRFSGGGARVGTLAGTCAADGTLDFAYCLVGADGSVVSGRCLSSPRLLPDGRIRLIETWERFGEHAASGVSVLDELPPETQTPTTASTGRRAS